MSDCEVAQFKRISIPLMRRIYPQLIANQICSVQPLAGPTGLVHYLRYKYSENKGGIINTDGWTIKPKKKKIWRDINDPWEPSSNG